MSGILTELILPTFSVRLLGRLVVFVNRPGLEIGDDDWAHYLEWLKALQTPTPELCILTAAGGKPPTTAQRSLLNREVRTDRLRVAVLLSDPKLVVVVRVAAWFMGGLQAFKAHELEKALGWLGEGDLAQVRTTIRDLGGSVHKEAL